MKILAHYLKHMRHKIGWLGIIILMVPILYWVWLVARKPVISVFNGTVPRYVISGRLFSEPFNRIHAGFALDQPTIGKWLFWFTLVIGFLVRAFIKPKEPRTGPQAATACNTNLGM